MRRKAGKALHAGTPGRIGRTRRFDGKTYALLRVPKTRSEAQGWAKYIRARGWFVRITEHWVWGYALWGRKKR